MVGRLWRQKNPHCFVEAAALATALTRLIDDAELRRAFGWAGREKVLRDYRLEQRIERIRDFYLQRLANVNSPKAGGGSQ
jgi:glycosyltransferase involved in cell wall biosynthesis